MFKVLSLYTPRKRMEGVDLSLLFFLYLVPKDVNGIIIIFFSTTHCSL
jgi:hypothetical protein